jgi:hypothetical protein
MSLELINPDGSPGFQVNAGLRIRGGASRSPVNPKHNFRVLMKKEYGAEALEYPLFGPEGARRSEKFDLRCEQLIGWVAFPDENADFIRDIYGRDTQAALGQPAPRGNFYHLYINGQYWGLYQTDERIGAEYAAEYFGGSTDDYDTVKINFDFDSTGGGTDFVDGSFGAWRRAVDMGYEGFESNEAYFKVQGLNPDGSRNEAFEPLIDADNLIDYMLAGIYIAVDDSPPSFGTQNNWYGVRSRKGDFGFRFFAHDWEIAMLDPTGEENRVGEHPTENPFHSEAGGPVDVVRTLERPALDEEDERLDPTSANPWHFWQAMRMNAEFRLRVADHVQRFFFNEGALTQENAVARWRARMEEIDQAVIGESARWGDARSDSGFPGFDPEESFAALLTGRREAGKRPRLVQLAPGQDEDDLVIPTVDPPTQGGPHPSPSAATARRVKPYTRDTWLRACNEHILNGFLANRTANVIGHLKAGLLYPDIDAPSFAPFGGVLPVEGTVAITPPMVSDGSNPEPVAAPVYFTTNGDDPRLVGGVVGSSAQLYATPLRFAKETTLKARARNQFTGEWSALVEATYVPGSDFGGLKITEIFYTPPPFAGRDGEFVELQNTGSTALDLSGLHVTGEIAFTFPEGTILQPGAFFLLVRHPLTFATLHPGVTPDGVFTGTLAESGGRITIETAGGARVLSVRYDDEGEWPSAPDGFDFSLTYDGKGDPDEGKNWYASYELYGTPKRASALRVSGAPIVITKVGIDAAGPIIEITNPSTQGVIDVGNSSLLHRGLQIRLPQVSLQPGESLLLHAAELNGLNLSSAGGEVAFQYGLPPEPPASDPTRVGYVHRFEFGPFTAGAVYGRVVTSDGREYFPRLDAAELAPQLSDLRIEEVNYFPRATANIHEFVELANHAETAAGLDGARLAGLAFSFPAAAVVPAQGRALIVGIDPENFRTLHNVPANVPIFGPASGALQDDGERIAIEVPVVVNGVTVFTPLEELRYNDKQPWPVLAAGHGHSLQRLGMNNYAAEPTFWGSAEPTPGLANTANAAPRVTFGTTGVTNEYLTTATDVDGSIVKVELFVDGEVIAESSEAAPTFFYRPTNGVHDLWARATDDRGATALSDTFTLDASDVPDGAGLGLLAEYFTNTNLEGNVAATANVTKIGGDWLHLDPANGVSRNSFSVRYSGKLVPRSNGSHTFNFLTTGGLRLYVNGELVLDHWTDEHAAIPTPLSHSADLVGGESYDFTVEYFDDDGLASLSLLWNEAGSFIELPIPSALFYLPSQDPLTPAIAVPGGLARRFLGQTVSAKFLITNRPEGSVTWSIASGAFPPGLELGSDGEITGKPTDDGTFTFAVSAEVIPEGEPAMVLSRQVTMLVFDRAIAAPVVKVLNPKGRVADPGPVNARGTASGPRPIARVHYSLNGGPSHELPGGTEWSVLLAPSFGLTGGDNVLSVRAEDVDGRLSTLIDHHFTRQYPSMLTVTIEGSGRVTAGFLGSTTRIVGKSYAITATPAAGHLFAGWGDQGTDPRLHFTMSDDLVLNAVFVPNPFIGTKGIYTTSLGEGENTHRHRGRASFNLTDLGEFTGTVDFAAARYALKGRLDPTGNASLFPVDPKTGRSVEVTLAFDTTSREFTASVHVWEGNELVTIASPLARVPWSAALPCPHRGRWNVGLPPAVNPAPQGHGFVTVAVTSRGVVRSQTRLPDGKVATQSGWILESGLLPFYAALGYDPQTTIGESLSGGLQFSSEAISQITGALLWARASDPSIIIGNDPAADVPIEELNEIFARTIEVSGSRFRAPAPGQLVVNLPNGTFTLTGPESGFTLTKTVHLNAAHAFAFEQPGTNRPSLSIDPATGRASGRITLGEGPATQTVTLRGIADQATNTVRGFFVDDEGRTGALEIHP